MSFFRISMLSIPWRGLSPWKSCNLIGRFSQSASYHFEAFLDKEMEKAQRELDTETLDDPTSLLKKLERNQKRRILAKEKARTARLFRLPQEPRVLSRDTMEQIRFLKQEHGEEWSIPKLASSFGVTEKVIIRVLKSKFVPSEKTLGKQDQRAAVNAGLIPGRTPSEAGHANPEKLRLSAVVKTPTRPTKPGTESDGRNWQQKGLQRQFRSENMPSWRPTCEVRNHTENPGSKTRTSGGVHFRRDNVANEKSRYKKGIFEQECNVSSNAPGTVNDEKPNIDIENLSSYDDGIRPPGVVRRGDEFFDENGEFLYRV